MKRILSILTIFACFSSFAQNEFELKTNDEGKVFYQDVIKADSSSLDELMDKALSLFKTGKEKVTSEDRKLGIIKAETELTTKGQRPDKSKEYFYTFSYEITLEFKDGKVRYTFANFKKKSSPGEPGSTLEAFIDSYNPVISSESTRAKAAQRLDKMEIAIQDHIDNTIVRLKDTFDPSDDSDW